MIAVDSSSMIAYLGGEEGGDSGLVDRAIASNQMVFPPIVLSELLSEPQLSAAAARNLSRVPLLEISEGFWMRAGLLRARILRAGRKGRLADVLIAQVCLDHEVPLVTRDGDFRAFAELAGLEILPG